MTIRLIFIIWMFCFLTSPLVSQNIQTPIIEKEKIYFYKSYPESNNFMPLLPSPFQLKDGSEYVIALTREGKYAIIPVSLTKDRSIVSNQLYIHEEEFPSLASKGLHNQIQLASKTSITKRNIDEITKLAYPGALSQGGFIAADESILSVLLADNQLVEKMGLTHPALAKCLFHVINLMDEDLELNRWNMASHEWQNICFFYYHGQKVFVKAYDTKGGQKSIFNDGIEGAFHIQIKKELSMGELIYLKDEYSFLDEEEFQKFIGALTLINFSEIHPQYIMRYAFYEGHTFWRSDPISIAYIFGFKSIEELNLIFEGKLHKILLSHHNAN